MGVILPVGSCPAVSTGAVCGCGAFIVLTHYSNTQGLVAAAITAIHRRSGSIARVDQPRDGFFQVSAIKRLGQIAIHPGIDAGSLAGIA